MTNCMKGRTTGIFPLQLVLTLLVTLIGPTLCAQQVTPVDYFALRKLVAGQSMPFIVWVPSDEAVSACEIALRRGRLSLDTALKRAIIYRMKVDEVERYIIEGPIHTREGDVFLLIDSTWMLVDSITRPCSDSLSFARLHLWMDTLQMEQLRRLKAQYLRHSNDRKVVEAYLKFLVNRSFMVSNALFTAWYRMLELPDLLESNVQYLLVYGIPDARLKGFDAAVDIYQWLRTDTVRRQEVGLSADRARAHLMDALTNGLRATIRQRDKAQFEQLLAYVDVFDTLRPDLTKRLWRLKWYRHQNQRVQYINDAQSLVGKYILHAVHRREELDTLRNDTTWSYEAIYIYDTAVMSALEASRILAQLSRGIAALTDDPQELDRALAWMHCALQLHEDYRYYPVIGALWVKKGDYYKGMRTITRAIHRYRNQPPIIEYLRKKLPQIYDLIQHQAEK